MSQNRQLAAIMFTDIEGYTSLMQHDEKKAIALRDKHRDIFEASTEKHKGTIVQYFGDGTLSVFKSTVEAVDCAIEIQLAFLEDPKIPVRIGIHVGDIVYSKEDIIGDAVNVASRIESCAVAGSILISDKVHDQIRSHKQFEVTFLDAYDLKNVEDAMPIFAVSNIGLVVPKPEDIKGKLKKYVPQKEFKISVKKILGVLILILGAVFLSYYFGLFTFKATLSDKSIAVLPFNNFSNDDDSEIFSEGVTEDILTQLSKLKELHVISRTSVMQYKNTKKTIPQIAKELSVTYILEGSIQKYGDQVRVTAQLIDTKNDKHVWAEKYDMTLTNIFDIQTKVSGEIVNALNLNLSFEEQQSITTIPTRNIEAYQLFLRGRKEADKRNKESINKSIELYKQAIGLDPNYAEAYAEIANSIFLQTYYGGADPNQASRDAQSFIDKAEKIDSKNARVFTVKGLLYNHMKEYEKAKVAFDKAIALSPNDVTARHQFATFYYYTEQYEKQLEQTRIAYSLDPLSFATASSYFTALTSTENYDEAEKLIQDIVNNNKESDPFVINRLYIRLYMAQPDYKKAIEPLKYLAANDKAYLRFLGYSYGQLGETKKAYQIIDSIKAFDKSRLRNHRIAVVFSGMEKSDSVFYYLDTARNKSRLFNSNRLYYFNYLKDSPDYKELLNAHGIEAK